MALDQWLLDDVKAGGAPVLRLYGWQPACLSLGRNQPARGCVDDKLLRQRGVDLVRRPTGGQAVLHADELTYAVAAPLAELGAPRAAYTAINRALLAALQEFGVDAALAGGTPRGAPDWQSPCFESAAAGEVTWRGRKLVGSAQRCEQRTLLQHGSILLSGDQRLVAETTGAQPAGAAAPATLEEALGYRPDPAELARGIATAFAAILGIALAPHAFAGAAGEEFENGVARFRSEEWTWRR